ncbi:AAA family ATPase [Streptomyces lydicus]|nr:AAA family ATPase [Streptomyces lydicus]
MVEREYSDALEDLVGQLDACTEGGGGRLALVTGGLASGKTHLVHAFAQHATQNGALHLMATGSRAERDFSGGVVDQLFRNSHVPAEAAARVTRLLSGLAEAGTGSGAAPLQAEARVLHTLCIELLELAQQCPLVISVDDIQFADAFSLWLILHLRQRMAAAPVMIVLTEWNWGLPALSRFHADLARQPYQLVELTALPVAAVAAGLAERTTPQQAKDHAAHVHWLAGGNPLLVHALTTDLRNGRPLPSASCAEAGPAFTQAVLNCLYRWDGDLLGVAQGIAVLDDHASAPLVAELMSLPADRVGRALNALTAAGLVDGSRLRHPAARAAALSPSRPPSGPGSTAPRQSCSSTGAPPRHRRRTPHRRRLRGLLGDQCAARSRCPRHGLRQRGTRHPLPRTSHGQLLRPGRPRHPAAHPGPHALAHRPGRRRPPPRRRPHLTDPRRPRRGGRPAAPQAGPLAG